MIHGLFVASIPKAKPNDTTPKGGFKRLGHRLDAETKNP